MFGFHRAAVAAGCAMLPAFANAGAFPGASLLTPPASRVPVVAPMAAINDSHQTVALWQQGTQVVARIRNGAGWDAAVALTPADQTSVPHALASAKTGEAAAMFAMTASGGAAPVENVAFLAGGHWTAAQPIPATPGSTVLAARVAYDGQGMATLLWVEQSGAACAVRAALGSAAGGWAAPQTLGAGCYPFAQLAVNSGGEAVIGLGAPSFVRHGGSPWVVASRTLAGAWTPLINLGTGVYATPPAVAIADNGAALAAFSDANYGVMWSRRARVDGSWSAPAVIDGGVPAVPVALAMAANGRAVAVYNSYYPVVPPAGLMAATLPNGSNSWSAPGSVTLSSSTIDTFQVAATPGGTFAVGWVDSTPPTQAGAVMGASRLAPGATAWVQTELDTDRSGLGGSPSPFAVALAAAAGRAVAVWDNNDAKGVALDTVRASIAAVR